MAAADHLARAAAAARNTAHDLPAARKTARDAVGVDHPGENWISRELDRFFGWIAGLLRHLEFNLSPGGAGGLRLVTWLVILAIIVGAVVLIVRVLTRWRPRAGSAPAVRAGGRGNALRAGPAARPRARPQRSPRGVAAAVRLAAARAGTPSRMAARRGAATGRSYAGSAGSGHGRPWPNARACSRGASTARAGGGRAMSARGGAGGAVLA